MSRVERSRSAPAVSPGYDQDFFAWTQHTAALLRAGRLGEVDLEHVAEEVEDVGKRDRRAVENRLEVLLAHLLRWARQQEGRSGS